MRPEVPLQGSLLSESRLIGRIVAQSDSGEVSVLFFRFHVDLCQVVRPLRGVYSRVRRTPLVKEPIPLRSLTRWLVHI